MMNLNFIISVNITLKKVFSRRVKEKNLIFADPAAAGTFI